MLQTRVEDDWIQRNRKYEADVSVINAPSSSRSPSSSRFVVDVMTIIRAVLKCTRRDAATTPGNFTCNAIIYNCYSFITTVFRLFLKS